MITTRDFQWSWQGQRLVLGLDEAGDGALVLLLPALSSISTRGEMRPLAERLASQFRVVAIDWPGFGTRPRPNVRWTPDALSTFLEHVLEQVVDRPRVWLQGTQPHTSWTAPRVVPESRIGSF